MEFSGDEQLTKAINSPADLWREDLLVVLKEIANLQSSYSQQSAFNKLINSCINYKKFSTLSQLVKLIGTRSTVSFINVQMINLSDAFNFLLQSSVLDCYETVKLFQENNVDLPDKAFDMVVSALISNDHMKEALELLFSQIKGEKVVNMNLREHIKLLLLRGEVENVFAVLEKYPITSIGALYLWEDVIKYTCSNDQAHRFREFLSKHSKVTIPTYLKEFEEIYSIYIKALIDNKCNKEILILTLKDVSTNNFTLKITSLKPALTFLISKNVDIELLVKTMKDFAYMMTSDVYSHAVSKLLQTKQFSEAVSLLDLIIHDRSFKFGYNDLNLSINDFKLILYLQNYAIRKEKFGEAKRGDSDYSVLLPDKSINEPIDKITFNELSSYLSKDTFEFL